MKRKTEEMPIKKILLSLLVVSLLFTSVKPIYAVGEPYGLETIETYEEYNSENGNTRNPALKFVNFVIQSIIGGIIYDVTKYLYTYEPDWNAVIEWAEEKGYDPDDFEVVSKRVVYDNGCWQPEFSANPFCKAILNKNEDDENR